MTEVHMSKDLTITRTFATRPYPLRIRVDKRHPQLGSLARGTITQRPGQPGDGPAMRWHIVDYDHNDLGEHVGDYLDAERILLDATAGLDVPLTADQLADVTA